jgi:Mn2+/Fe2+ NRAMP family transporter
MASAGSSTAPTRFFPPWDKAELSEAPVFRLRHWSMLIGPGLLMVGANIGGGEWLFGPLVTAQYGGRVMWIASLSILMQVFYNLSVMRYALYCGEPIFVGFFRTPPGPRFWTLFYIVNDLGGLWPYLSSNAAVPLAAVFLGRLPTTTDDTLVRGLGYAIFLSAFVPLIFGGKVYNAIEKVMVTKLV